MCVEVREISIKDINVLVAIHKRAFPDFFLTSLGDRFLLLYYKTVKKNNQGILLGYYREEICWFLRCNDGVDFFPFSSYKRKST